MKVSIHFSLTSGSSSDLPIRMRISYDGMRLDLRTGLVCPREKWDDASMRMRPGTTNRYKQTAAKVNRELSHQESTIITILERYDLEHLIPEPSVLKSDFEKAIGRKSRTARNAAPSETLLQLYDRFCVDYGRTNAWSHGTSEAYLTVRAHIEDADFSSRPISQLAEEDLATWITDLWADGLENQTVSAYLTRIRTFLRWAHDTAKVYHGDLHTTFRPKIKNLGKKDVLYLEWSEFETLLNTDYVLHSYEEIRDAFCFCCATGLRVSDCAKLKWADVFPDHIQVVTKKTARPIVIQLNRYARELIRKYAREDSTPMDLVFPYYDLRTRNQYLPIIAEQAKLTRVVRKLKFVGSKVEEEYLPIHKVISTHLGRHTFVVHALRLGIQPTVIMSWTGHASYESMRPYIAIVQEQKAESMALFDKTTDTSR